MAEREAEVDPVAEVEADTGEESAEAMAVETEAMVAETEAMAEVNVEVTAVESEAMVVAVVEAEVTAAENVADTVEDKMNIKTLLHPSSLLFPLHVIRLLYDINLNVYY